MFSEDVVGGAGVAVGFAMGRNRGVDRTGGTGRNLPERGAEKAGWFVMNPANVDMVRRIIVLVFILLFVVCSSHQGRVVPSSACELLSPRFSRCVISALGGAGFSATLWYLVTSFSGKGDSEFSGKCKSFRLCN